MAFAAALFSSCENMMDDINKNHDDTADVPAKFIMPDIILRTAQNIVGGDVNTYTSCYVEHNVGSHNQLYQAEMRKAEILKASTFNNTWGTVYDIIYNCKDLCKKCADDAAVAEDAGDTFKRGIAETIEALNAAFLTDLWGDAPYSQSCDLIKYPAPALDKQEDIYKEVMKLLDAAIADLTDDSCNPASAGSYDLLYGGTKTAPSKWTKFAYGLKARYTMRLAGRNNYSASDMNKVIEYCDQSFANASEQAAMQYPGYGADQCNPFADYVLSREGISASRSYADNLLKRNDPRANRIFTGAFDYWCPIEDILDDIAINGDVLESQEMYPWTCFMLADEAPIYLLSYHEVLFLKAEALTRLNQLEDAKAVMLDAYRAGIENCDAFVNAGYYLAGYDFMGASSPIDMNAAVEAFNEYVLPLYDANPVQEVMVQKYLSMNGANGESSETFNDVRRVLAWDCDKDVKKMMDFYGFKNQNNLTSGFPLRGGYGNNDTTTNPNVQKAYGNGQYVLTEPVWWAGGTR